MLSTHRSRNICLLLIIISGAVSMKENLFDNLNQALAKLFAGIELTTLYLFSLGTAYPPIDEDVTFWCVQPSGKELVQTYLGDPDIQSKIDFEIRTNFLIHGWMSGLDGGNRYLPAEVRESDGWMRSTSYIWSQMEDCNVCSVDWSRLTNYEYSVAALVNSNLVAPYIIEFMDFLIKNGMIVSESAIAGHSLGAQVAGIIGRHYNGTLDAIYGIDPAGPGFTIPWDFGNGTRLTKNDANYVQCIHTSCGTVGTLKDCGHADFYLNGGYRQPGCITVMCSHARAHDIFLEAMYPGNIFFGAKCRGSIGNFVSKLFGMQCSSETDRLGIHSERRPGRYFLKTNRKSPFAKPVFALQY